MIFLAAKIIHTQLSRPEIILDQKSVHAAFFQRPHLIIPGTCVVARLKAHHQNIALFAGKKHIPKCLTILRRKFFLIPPLDSLRIDSVHAAMPKRTNVHALTSKTL